MYIIFIIDPAKPNAPIISSYNKSYVIISWDNITDNIITNYVINMYYEDCISINSECNNKNVTINNDGSLEFYYNVSDIITSSIYCTISANNSLGISEESDISNIFYIYIPYPVINLNGYINNSYDIYLEWDINDPRIDEYNPVTYLIEYNDKNYTHNNNSIIIIDYFINSFLCYDFNISVVNPFYISDPETINLCPVPTPCNISITNVIDKIDENEVIINWDIDIDGNYMYEIKIVYIFILE